eukprot:Rmarinus@m.6265
MPVPSQQCLKRLKKEFNDLNKNPVENIFAAPLPSNILEWHYVVIGPADSHFEGGYYHGKLEFPADYPYKPPAILMITPNGRFHTNTRLCLSISDFHPETWNPMWSVGSILSGLLAFMMSDQSTVGSVSHCSTALKRKYATDSLSFNLKNETFRELFEDHLGDWKQANVEYMEKHPRKRATSAEVPSSRTDTIAMVALLGGLVLGLLGLLYLLEKDRLWANLRLLLTELEYIDPDERTGHSEL